MSYVKYREDDIKIIDNRMFLKGKNMVRPSKPAVHYYECKYCRHIFTSKSKLCDHIRNVHNIVRPLVIINDKVIGDSTILQYLDQAKIILYGYEGPILVNGKSLALQDAEEIDITNLLAPPLSEDKHCKITFKDTSVTIDLQPINIKDNPLIQKTINHWQTSVSSAHLPDESLLSNFTDSNLLFMQGVYNYYLGCSTDNYKAARYDEAFALLSHFNELNGIGRCILEAIAFRRNWIDSLKILTHGQSQSDIFTTASEYFSRSPSSFEYESDPSTDHLFVEEGTKTSLELISLFQKGKYSAVKRKLSSLGDIDDLDDKNLVEQLHLLEARLAAADGNKNLAIKYYEKLITPAFRDEYHSFIQKKNSLTKRKKANR